MPRLLQTQRAPFADLIGSRIGMHGPKLRLKAMGAEAIGLALHELGVAVVGRWRKFNAPWFDSALRPIPLVMTNTLPFGKWVGQCSHGNGRTITLNLPKDHNRLLADNCTLLHEMLHQLLQERGEDPKRAGAPWRREVMRLTRVMTGRDIWAGASRSVRQKKSVVRMNSPIPKPARRRSSKCRPLAGPTIISESILAALASPPNRPALPRRGLGDTAATQTPT